MGQNQGRAKTVRLSNGPLTQRPSTVDGINTRHVGKQGSTRAEYMKLDEMGILGVTHMMMLDTNSNQIADLMLDWVKKYVAKAPRR